MFIPRDIIVFVLGIIFTMAVAGFFTLVVDKENNDIDIDEDIRKFKKAIKSKFKKKKPEVQKQKQTKREVKKKLRKMFKD